MINKKKEGGFYASKTRQFLNEYDGIPLEEFCKAEKVSYNKMLNCLSRLRVYYFHHNGEILSEKILHAHRFTHPIFLDIWRKMSTFVT